MEQVRKRLAKVVQVVSLGPGLGRLELEGLGIGEGVTPGRFAMVEAPGRADCVLLRPFSYFTAEGNDRVELLVKSVGKGTQALLAAQRGDPVAILGPLGSAFPTPKGTCWAVAGGVGAAPFGVMRHRPGIRVLFGARSVHEAGFAQALRTRGADVHLATNDGSSGFRGNVVEMLQDRLKSETAPEVIYTCGPSVMMQAVAAVAKQHQIPCYASLEERMGCGIGVCRGCAHLDAAGGWRCICVDGPVYDAKEIYV